MAKKNRKTLASFIDLANATEEINFNEEKSVTPTEEVDKKQETENVVELEKTNEEAKKNDEEKMTEESVPSSVEKAETKDKPTEVELAKGTELMQSENINDKNTKINEVIETKDEEVQEEPDILKTIIEQKKRRDSKKLIGIYFDGDVAKVLDKIGDRGGRGAKSELVNDVLKAFFKKQGLLK